MDAVAFPPPPYASVALSEGPSGGLDLAASAGRHASVGSADGRQLGAQSRGVANVYDTPQAPGSRSPPLVRRGGCGDGSSAAGLPLAVCAFLIVVSVVAAAWSTRMALMNALETQRLLEMSAGCSGALGGGGLSHVASDDRRAHPAVGRAEGVCMISAAELLQEASRVGHETMSTTAPGAVQQRLPDAKTSQSNGRKKEARTLAHLGSAFYPHPEPELSYPHIDRWLDHSHFGSVLTGNLSNAGGGVTIGESGYYFVYSQVGYILAAKDADDVSSSTDHKLMRRQAASRGGVGSSEPILLARARKTRCWSSKSNCSLTSSYMGAVFRLDKGDVVTVDVDRARYVWYSPEHTYIGAHLLQS